MEKDMSDGFLVQPLTLADIKYPIYKIPGTQKLKRRGSRVYITDIYDRERLIVDLSYPGDTLGEKRIHSLIMGDTNLYNLNKHIYSLENMIKGVSNQIYIDTKCRVFNYVKSKVCRITYRRVEKVHDIPNTGIFLKLESTHCFVRASRLPNDDEMYAVVAEIGNGYLFVGYSEVQNEPNTLKI